MASREGHVDTVRALLEGGADPNAKEKNAGQTALMWAISGGHSAVTEELVKHKADVNIRSKGGREKTVVFSRGFMGRGTSFRSRN